MCSNIFDEVEEIGIIVYCFFLLVCALIHQMCGTIE